MRILIAEERHWIDARLISALEARGHPVDQAHCPDEVERMLAAGTHDVFLVNPDLVGLRHAGWSELCRSRGVEVVSIGSTPGGGDCIRRPMQSREVIDLLSTWARRRCSTDATTLLTLGDLQLDMERQQAARRGRQIYLTALEYRLLVLLLRHEGQVLSRTFIAEQVWGLSFAAPSNLVDVAVSRLRRKIDGVGDRKLIRTARGTGYSIEDD